MPVGDDLGPVGDEDVGVVGPFVDRIVDAIEVRPPERLVLALVEATGGGHHRDGRLLGGAFLDAVAREFEQSAFELVRGLGCAPVGHRQRPARGHP